LLFLRRAAARPSRRFDIPSPSGPAISIVTRTQNRSELLPRVRGGLLAQTRKDFEWVIFNVGGDADGPEREAIAARAAGIDVRLHRSAKSQGRSAAANAGVRLSVGRYVLLHDDDDALAPEFLEKTARQLNAQPDLVGSATWMWRIDETWNGIGLPQETGRKLFESQFDSLYLVDMAQRNRFAPIAFLYRRDAFDAIGGYDTRMDLLEDWDFNLRMMLRGDIGVVPEALAYYHIRNQIAEGGHRMANTVHARESEHWQSHAALQNRFLRHDLAQGRVGLGALMAIARLIEPAHQTQQSMERLKQALDRVGLRSLWRSFNRKG
jgi:glycosyltransferase involved in cell wall biosynthesis